MQKQGNNSSRHRGCSKCLLMAILWMCLMAACDDRQTYLHMYHTLPDGVWLAADTLCFEIPTQQNDTAYQVQLELRHTVNVRYQNLLLAASRVYHAGGEEVPTDTVNFRLMDDVGRLQGRGIGRLLQVEQQLKALHMDGGDSCVIKVFFLAPDSLLTGISDVGLRLY